MSYRASAQRANTPIGTSNTHSLFSRHRAKCSGHLLCQEREKNRRAENKQRLNPRDVKNNITKGPHIGIAQLYRNAFAIIARFGCAGG